MFARTWSIWDRSLYQPLISNTQKRPLRLAGSVATALLGVARLYKVENEEPERPVGGESCFKRFQEYSHCNWFLMMVKKGQCRLMGGGSLIMIDLLWVAKLAPWQSPARNQWETILGSGHVGKRSCIFANFQKSLWDQNLSPAMLQDHSRTLLTHNQVASSTAFKWYFNLSTGNLLWALPQQPLSCEIWAVRLLNGCWIHHELNHLYQWKQWVQLSRWTGHPIRPWPPLFHVMSARDVAATAPRGCETGSVAADIYQIPGDAARGPQKPDQNSKNLTPVNNACCVENPGLLFGIGDV